MYVPMWHSQRCSNFRRPWLYSISDHFWVCCLQCNIMIKYLLWCWLVVATRGSVLYFLIVEMSVVNIMYQTSLRQFLQVFDLSMARSSKSPFTAKRIQNIVEYLTFSTFSYTARGLYEKDKFLFTILMTLKIQLQAKAIRPEEFECFIKGTELVFCFCFVFVREIVVIVINESRHIHVQPVVAFCEDVHNMLLFIIYAQAHAHWAPCSA